MSAASILPDASVGAAAVVGFAAAEAAVGCGAATVGGGGAGVV
jgi:hypothetical protein